MKEYVLKKWYPSLPTDWHSNDFPIIVVEKGNLGYHLHPSLKTMTRFASISEREVERNEEFWEEIKPKKKYKKKYSIKDIVSTVNNWSMCGIEENDILNFLAKNENTKN